MYNKLDALGMADKILTVCRHLSHMMPQHGEEDWLVQMFKRMHMHAATSCRGVYVHL